MGEFHSGRESPEFVSLRSVVKLLAEQEKAPRKPPEQPRFAEIALGNSFKAQQAIALLSGTGVEYPGFGEVLFAGLCAWTVAPADEAIRLSLMTQAVLDHVAAMESEASAIASDDFEADVIARYLFVGGDFLRDVYFPLGGHAIFATAMSRPIIEDYLFGARRSIEMLAKALGLLHHAGDRFEDRSKYLAPSQNRIVTVLDALEGDARVSRSAFLERWSENKATLALLYAASTIKTRGKTLLDAILSGEVNARDHMLHLPEWLPRARYVCDYVIKPLAIKGLYEANSKPLKATEPKRFRPSAITPKEEAILIAAFLPKRQKDRSK